MKVLDIRKKNYGLNLGRQTRTAHPWGNGHMRRSPLPYEYEAEIGFANLKNKRLKFTRGDIIRFEGGFRKVGNELGVIIDRIRVIKHKDCGTYSDLCSVVMVITGPYKGVLIYVSTLDQGKLKLES